MAEQMTAPLIPMFSVRDPKATIEWFRQLGFEPAGVMQMPDGSIGHAEVRRDPLVFMFGPAMGEVGSAGLELYVNLNESVDAYHDTVVRNGAHVSEALQDQFWGDRTFKVEHPDGYKIMFAQHVRDVSEEEMKQAMEQWAAAPA